MHILLKTVFASIVSLSVIGCGNAGDAPERGSKKAIEAVSKMELPELVDKITEDMDGLTAVLSEVDDEESAEKAVALMRKVAPEYKAVQERMEAIGDDGGDMKMLMTMMKKGPVLAQSAMKLNVELERINRDHPELREMFYDVSEEFDL